MTAGRTPRVWMAAIGIAATLGSEPQVGWQWYRRLRAHGPVTVLTTSIFDDDRYIPAAARPDMVFLDCGARDADDFQARFGRSLIGWWLAVRRHLAAHAGPEDLLFITTPAAVWMLPLVIGLPMARERIFFGPMGLDLVPAELRGGRAAAVRDLRTRLAMAAWRLLAPWLPGKVALRAPLPGVERPLGRRVQMLGAVAEATPPPLPPVPAALAPPAAVALLYDPRPRKRFDLGLAYAVDLARATALPLVAVGLPADRVAAVRAAASGLAVDLLPRLDRGAFTAWLAATRPHLVALSLSEGVSATLLETLCLGGHVHAHDAGGTHWLIRHADRTLAHDWRALPVTEIIWGSGSAGAYAAAIAADSDAIVTAMLATLRPAPIWLGSR